ISVKEGDSLTLNSGRTEITKGEMFIQWRFGYENTLIAEINKQTDSVTVYDDVLDGRFRNRLKLDKQTGSLTIRDTRYEHNGVYELEGKSLRKSFSLTIIDEISMKEGDSLTLNSGLTEIKDDEIQWKLVLEDILIAKIKKQTNSMTVYEEILDERFRDRLKLNKQTGSLTITNTTTQHAGVYELLINNVRKRLFLAVYGESTICSTCFIFFITRYNIILHTVLLFSVCSVVSYYYSFGDYI
uniref:Uncharacterized protein n=1 Tax=Cyprinus carpio TaxID=7962 RepID=A0A8C1SVE6_CYPCA